MIKPTNDPIDEILFKYGEEMTDVQHIKARQAIKKLLIEARIEELDKLAKTPYIQLMKYYKDRSEELQDQLNKLEGK